MLSAVSWLHQGPRGKQNRVTCELVRVLLEGIMPSKDAQMLQGGHSHR